MACTLCTYGTVVTIAHTFTFVLWIVLWCTPSYWQLDWTHEFTIASRERTIVSVPAEDPRFRETTNSTGDADRRKKKSPKGPNRRKGQPKAQGGGQP